MGFRKMLSNISEYELAKIFIYSKQEKIKKVLNRPFNKSLGKSVPALFSFRKQRYYLR